MNSSNKQENSFYGSIYGFCIGDILGVPVEFKKREVLKEDPVISMRAYGTYNQPLGSWSDDTSLTFCLIDSLVEHGYNISKISWNMLSWYELGKWTSHGKVFDIGGTTKDAFKNIKYRHNKRPTGINDECYSGNGALMRISPLVFYLKDVDDFIERVNIVEEIGSITHAHYISNVCCVFYVEFLIKLLKGIERKTAYHQVQQELKDYYKELLDITTFYNLFNKEIYKFREKEIKSTGYVVDTLEAVLWAFFTNNNYISSVLAAINLGGDTDTIGAITGSIAGLYYGYSDIPKEWINNIPKKDNLDKLFDDFYKKYVI